MPQDWLREEFRTRFLDGLQRAYERGELVLTGRHGHLLSPQRFAQWMAHLRTCYWNVHAEPVDVGRSAEMTREEAARRTLGYLAAYANGVALHNDRLLAIEDDHVVFSYKDYRDHGRVKIARVPAVEFIDRFLLHVLPAPCSAHSELWISGPESAREEAAADPPTAGDARAGARVGGRRAAAGGGRGRGRSGHGSPGGRVPCARWACWLEITWPRPTIAQIMQMTMEQLRQFRLPFQ